MKYLCHLTAPVTTTFSADNYRGEPRWERNVCDALTTYGKHVHTTRPIWNSALDKPFNFHNGPNTEWLDDSVLISYGVEKQIYTGSFPEDLEIPYRIIQYFDGPTEATKDTFFQYLREKPQSIICTYSFKTWEYEKRLHNVLGKENCEWVIGPTVPCVDESADNFRKPTLFWAYRNFLNYLENDPAGMDRLFGKVHSIMAGNPEFQLKILIHLNYGDLHKEAAGSNGLDWFLNLPFGKRFLPFKDRIELIWNVHWSKMLSLMKETSLIISPAEPLGGPPFEAAIYGIPTVFSNESNAFTDRDRMPFFPELLMAPKGINNRFLDLISALHEDHLLYTACGNAIRNFTKANATYEAYVKKIESITQARGWNV